MMPDSPLVLTCEQCRRVDAYAIRTLVIPGVILMENAGRNVAECIIRHCAPRSTDERATPFRAAIVCGKGNNGGDGFVVARHLLRCGWAVTVDLLTDPSELTGDARINFMPLERLGISCRRLTDQQDIAARTPEWETCDAVVDALLGTGFTGDLREPMATVVRAINSLTNPLIVAIDVPSGLNADTGAAGGGAVEADLTVTFLGAKPAFAGTARYTGEVAVVDIGIPLEVIQQVTEI